MTTDPRTSTTGAGATTSAPDEVRGVVTVVGTDGPPVLLIAGGASTSHRFFPGLESLDGFRVVSLDRPGTGRAQDHGTASLPSGAVAAAAAITDLGAGPAVVVAQSLGGPVALQLAVDFPELVAGLVLIDPTPIDQPKLVPVLRRVFGVVGLPGRLPVVGARLDRLMWRAMAAKQKRAPGTDAALEAMIGSISLAKTARAVDSLAADTAALDPRIARLGVPVVLLTAERKPGHAIRASHDRLVERLGGRIVAPPGAEHAEQLRDPDGVNALVREVLAEAFAAR